MNPSRAAEPASLAAAPLAHGAEGPFVEEDAIDLRQTLAVLRRYAVRIVGLALVVALLAALAVFSMQPIYRGTATLLIEPNAQNVVSIEQVYAPGAANAEYYQTQFELLRSRQIAARVVERLDLVNRPGFLAQPRGPGLLQRLQDSTWGRLKALLPAADDDQAPAGNHNSPTQAAIAAVRGGLDVTPVRGSQLTYIHFEHPDARVAADVANAVAQAYIEGGLEARLEMTQQAAGWITERLSGLRAALEKSEAALQRFRDENSLVSVQGDVLGATASALEQTTVQLVEARREQSRLATLYRQAAALRSEPVGRLESTPAVLQHPLIQSLKQEEARSLARVSELSERYGSKHPSLVQARSELAQVRAQLAVEVGKVVDGIEQEYRAATANVAQIEAELGRRRADVQEINRKQYELGTLEREVETNRQLYDMFLTRFKETDASEDLRTVNARVVDAAVVPDVPSKPRKGLIIALAGLLAGLAGVALAFLIDRLNDVLEGTADVESKLALPVIGLVPRVTRAERASLGTLVLRKPQAAFSEAVRTVRTGITLSGLDDPRRVLLVTSAVDGEGKTTLAADLALSFSQLERVVLVECDLRRPALARTLRLDGKGRTLGDALASPDLPAQDCVQRVAGSELDVLVAGHPAPNALEVLSSQRFARLIEELAGRYDRVILDSPPVQLVSDSLVLAGHTAGVVFVVRADSTPAGACRGAVKRLREVRAPLIGVVLNQVPVGRRGRYAGYYGDYYGLGGRYATR